MSMLTPIGMGGRPRQRRGTPRRGRALSGLLALALLSGGGYGAWRGGWLDPVTELAGLGTEVSAAVCTAPPAPPPLPPALPPTAVTVNVFNATGRLGLAAEVATELKARGFMVAEVSNDPLARTVPGTAELRHSPQGDAAARTVAAQVQGATVAPDLRADASVDLVMGAAYVGMVTPEEALVRLSPPAPQAAPAC
jgi:hypothetical protein